MSERAAKCRRLAASGIPQSKLVALIRQLQENPELLEERLSRATFKRSLDALWDDVGLTETLARKTGEPFEWACLSLPKMLQAFARTSPDFREVVGDVWRRTP